MTRIIQRREECEVEKDTTDTTHIRQMHEDMLNCLEVASQMVDKLESLVAKLQATAERESVVTRR